MTPDHPSHPDDASPSTDRESTALSSSVGGGWAPEPTSADVDTHGHDEDVHRRDEDGPLVPDESGDGSPGDAVSARSEAIDPEAEPDEETGPERPGVEPRVPVGSRRPPPWSAEVPVTVLSAHDSVGSRVAALVPGMRVGAPKRNLLVGLLYTVATMTLTTVVQFLL